MWISSVLLSLLIFTNIYSINATSDNLDELNYCEQQVIKYQKILLTAILNSDDICDLYERFYYTPTHDLIKMTNSHRLNNHNYANNNNDNNGKSGSSILIRILSENFNGSEFIDVLKDAMIEKCFLNPLKSEKRDGVIIGKKQRFHSWGGKRSSSSPLTQKILQNSENFDIQQQHMLLPKADTQNPWTE